MNEFKKNLVKFLKGYCPLVFNGKSNFNRPKNEAYITYFITLVDNDLLTQENNTKEYVLETRSLLDASIIIDARNNKDLGSKIFFDTKSPKIIENLRDLGIFLLRTKNYQEIYPSLQSVQGAIGSTFDADIRFYNIIDHEIDNIKQFKLKRESKWQQTDQQ